MPFLVTSACKSLGMSFRKSQPQSPPQRMMYKKEATAAFKTKSTGFSNWGGKDSPVITAAKHRRRRRTLIDDDDDDDDDYEEPFEGVLLDDAAAGTVTKPAVTQITDGETCRAILAEDSYRATAVAAAAASATATGLHSRT